jgi:hypothetical protein
MTITVTTSGKNIRFGTEDFSADEIDTLAAQLFATDVGTAEEADYQARRFIEEMFSGADPWKNIYALWHWCGGIRATAADLWSVLAVIEANSGDVIYRLTPNWSEHESLLSSITDSIYDSMSTGVGFEEPANALAALLTSLCEKASAFVGFDEGTNSWEDSNNLLSLIDTWMSLADCLMRGPNAEGRYLPDEGVYGVLAGASPQVR